ncbi:glycosyl transferase family 4 [Nitrosospira sp. Nsp2]|nr:glycosyl transferase family 4 [Nitrosospira sp. Nsp2]
MYLGDLLTAPVLMNILITNNTLATLGGSEWVVVELARALSSRGHQVAACSSQIAEAGTMLKGMSIPVIPDPFDSPFKPDVIHGQHHLDTVRALCAFPDVPAIYHCHGYLPWVEDPPVHPRIRYYVGMSSVVSERIRFSLGLSDRDVMTIPNWVDLDRFRFVRDPRHKPRKALLYLRSFDRHSWHASQLCQAFEWMGIKLDLWMPQRETRAPEVVLPQYDIVLASGRSAIEAMASGCAVLPISPSACLDLVDLTNFDFFQSQNFSPRLSTGQFNAESIVRAVSSYNPEHVKAVTEAVRSRCTLSAATDALESLYLRTVEGFSDQYPLPSARFTNELHAMANYIQSLMPMVRDRERLLLENNHIQQVIAVQEQTITALHRSNSMRITKPIRVISNLLRRLRSTKPNPGESLGS